MPLRSLDFSSRADQDLNNIFNYTFHHWGEKRAVQYSEELISSMSLLREFPNMGRDRSDIQEQLRSLAIAHHIVLYRVFTERVFVSRVIHQRENAAKALDEMDSD